MKYVKLFFGIMMMLCITNISVAQSLALGPNKLNDSKLKNTSQNESSGLASLEKKLSELEHKYKVSFFYKSETIKGKMAASVEESEGLEQTLTKLLAPHDLDFKKGNNNLYVIVSKSESNEKEIKKIEKKHQMNNNSTDELRLDERSEIKLLAGRFSQNLFVQRDINVRGRVTSAEDQSGLPGVNIIVKGTTIGTTSDSDGRYSINVPSETSTLIFSFIGFTSEEVELNGRNMVDISLAPDINTLEEIVVIGFGERKKKDLTGSISTVNAQSIEKIPFASPEFALQGNTPGVRVVNTSGNPSEAPQIFVRGVGTWNGNSQPLFVIDGQIVTPPTASNMDLIGNVNLWTLVNPQDIESLTVLKDASAAAIYGSRAANGVVLITTKSGKKGKPVIEFNAQTSIQNTPTFDVLNSSQLIGLAREMYVNNVNPDVTLERNLYGREQDVVATKLNNHSPQFDPLSPYYIGEDPANYDWQDAVQNKGARNDNYNIKVSGANDFTNFYISAGYNKQESLLRGNDLERYNLTINLNTSLGKFIRTGITYRGTYQTSDNNQTMNLSGAATMLPWQPIYDENDLTGFARPVDPMLTGSWNPVRRFGQGTRQNGIALNKLNYSRFELMRNMGQGFLEVEPIKALKIRGGLSVDYTYQQRKNFGDVRGEYFKTDGREPSSLGGGNSYGTYGLRNNSFLNYQADLTISYNRIFGNHSIDLLAGVQDQFIKQWNQESSTENAPTNDIRRISIPNERSYTDAFGGLNNQRYWYGYVGRIGYNYNSKYYLDLSFRRDGSSGFPDDPDKRWGNFYAASAAWRISSEEFLRNVPFINDLKIRAGWGQAGNDEAVVGQFAFLSTVAGQGTYSLGAGPGDPRGIYNLGVTIPAFPNRDISWETVTTTNIGFDAILFNNKINLTVEVYERITSDILQFVNLPLTVGTNSPAFNIGSARNRGIDIDVGYNGSVGAFQYGISGNISFLENEVLELYNDQPLSTDYGRVEEGRSIGHIWGYKVGGIFQTQQEIDDYYAQYEDEIITDKLFVQPGDMYFLDVQGNPTEEERFYSKTPDGKINQFDQTEIGNTIPGHTYGLNLTASWKGIDFSMNFYGEGSVDRYNTVRNDFERMDSPTRNYWTTVLNRWTPERPSTVMPRAVAGDPAANNRFSERWIESAAFFRLNTWQLGYSLPNNLLEKTNVLSSVRVFFGGQNNIYITNWSGIDPVNDVFPLPRGYSFGINARF